MKKNITIVIVILLLIAQKLSSQSLKADFSASAVKGCSPLTITFKNLSYPSTGINYSWEFGNGIKSTVANPVILFTEPGQYSVKLVISNGLNSDTLIRLGYITVFKNPQANFDIDVDNSGCAPYKVSFRNKTILGDTTINYYHWDFGDGFISADLNPVYTFNYQNNYTISLYIKDKNNCNNLVVKDNYLSVYKPVSDFLCIDSVSCSGVLQTRFINKSTGIGPLEFNWNFGNSLSSKETNPETYYTGMGNYDVKLATTDIQGCTDTLVKASLIKIENLNVSFSVNKDTLCANEEIILNNLTNLDGISLWDFGDGSTTNLRNPKHKYSKPGNYKIRLTYTIEQGCSGVYEYTVNVENIVADYISSKKYGCEEKVEVYYTDRSVNAVIWDWRFGNKINSGLQNPVNTYITEGVYIDTLIVTSKHGCKNMKVVNPGLVVSRPKALFSPNDWVEPNSLKGCTPLTVNFKDKSVINTTYDSIVSRSWSFGDGGISSEKNPSHVFYGTAQQLVSLTITSQKGCKSEFFATAKTGTKQRAEFKKEGPDVICASTPVQFIDFSKDSMLVNEWYWKFGDGTTSTKKNPLHFFVDTGYMEVKLFAYNNGCPDECTRSKYIYVKGPILHPDYSTACTNPLSVQLKANAKDANKIYWYYGDGSLTDSSGASPIHKFPASGNYKVRVKAINYSTACSVEASKDVIVRNIDAFFDMDKTIGCPGTTVSLNPSNSIDEYNFIYNNKSALYLWNFGDGTETFSSTVPLSHQFKNKGTYQIKLKVKDFRGCEDSIIRQVRIFQPEIGFTADNYKGCMPMSVDFTNKTLSDTSIVKWEWKFGDNSSSYEKDPIHVFTQFGVYDVSLKATDKLGCSNTLLAPKFIEALKPSPDFAANDQTACMGDTIKFLCLSKDKIKSYSWDFGDGTGSGAANPIHIYSNPGHYNVRLSLIDEQGCDSSQQINGFIDLQSLPVVDFDVDKTVTNCFPLIANFTDKSEGTNICRWEWNFDENHSFSYSKNPIHTFTKPGFYDISLKASTSYGCSNTLTKPDLIEVKGPWADINAPEYVCKDAEITFVAEGKRNVYELIWFFNDGTISQTDTAIHIFHSPGMYKTSLLLKSDDLHTCDKYFFDTVVMNDLHAVIYEDESQQSGCIPFSKNFMDQSVGASTWSWSFGDGNSSNEQNPFYLYPKDGKFDVKLLVSNHEKCEDSVHTTITVFPLPKIQVTRDTSVCRGSTIQLQADGALTYVWMPNLYLNSDLISNPVAKPDESVSYQVMGIDSNHCINYANTKLNVQQVPVINLHDTTIIIGEIVMLNAYSPDLFSYQWTPSYALNNTKNPYVVAQPLESTSYKLTVEDKNHCFEVSKDFNIHVRKEYTIDVPSAFTPNGDGINDKIFVKGWGMKELLEFRIYNRFGGLVFISNNKDVGWDGIYNGLGQNIETYTYYAKVRTFEDEIIEKSGTFKLLK